MCVRACRGQWRCWLCVAAGGEGSVRLGTIVDGIWDDDSWSHRAPTRKRSVGVISHSNVAPGELSPAPAQTGGTSPTGRRR